VLLQLKNKASGTAYNAQQQGNYGKHNKDMNETGSTPYKNAQHPANYKDNGNYI
jgi:hypothetical protein